MVSISQKDITLRFAKVSNTPHFVMLVYTYPGDDIHFKNFDDFIKTEFPDSWIDILCGERQYFFFESFDAAEEFFSKHYNFFREHRDYFYFEINKDAKFYSCNT